MHIKLGFTNTNTGADGIRVYRSNNPIDVNNLPAPLTTLAGDANSYTDNTVLKDQTYYYIFEVFKGSNVSRTANIKATAVFYTGPGPQILKGGDLTAGYYGLVSSAEFIDWDALIAFCGITTQSKHNQGNQDWLKFINNGKTLFIPRQSIGTTTWNTLYSKGLVYGVDGIGPREYNTQVARNQLTVITIGGIQFKIRLMRGLPKTANLAAGYLAANNTGSVAAIFASSNAPDSYLSNYDLSGSEWNDLMMRVNSWTPTNQKGENWDRLDQLLYFNNGFFAGWNCDTLFQEMLSTGSIISRGKLSGTTGAGTTLHADYALGISASANFHWQPVLEMI